MGGGRGYLISILRFEALEPWSGVVVDLGLEERGCFVAGLPGCAFTMGVLVVWILGWDGLGVSGFLVWR